MRTALADALREAARGLAVAGALSLFLNLLVLVSPLYMFQVFDRVLASGHVETLVALTVIAGFALLVLGLLEVIRRRALLPHRRLARARPVRTGARGERRARRWPAGDRRAGAARPRPAARLHQQPGHPADLRCALDAGVRGR